MKPNTTFTEFNQPPLFGIFWSTEGKSANSTKGNANTVEKTNIVRIGVQMSLVVDTAPMIAPPTIGPVHENDTKTNVSARKKTPSRPLRSEFWSLLLTHELGRVISNAPKNDAAKTINTRKKMVLGSQCVASQLKMSAVTVAPPTTRVIRISAAMGRV